MSKSKKPSQRTAKKLAPLKTAIASSADIRFDQWSETHNNPQINLPIKGRLYGALIVLSQLESGSWQFSELSEVKSTDKGDFFGDRSIRGHTASRIAKVLREKNRDHLIPSGSAGEQGRTSTGTKRAGLDLIILIWKSLESADNPKQQAPALVDHLFGKVLGLLDQHAELGGIEIDFKANETISSFITRLASADVSNPGALLQHLVGAKLEMRYEDDNIALAHHSASTADVQTGRLGDFEIGTTVFHVTKTPTADHVRKALQNANSGRRAYILTTSPTIAQSIAREVIKANELNRIEIFALDQFITQNLDELAIFNKDAAVGKLKQLLERYNKLISEHERDKSLLIQIPDLGVD